MNRHFNNGVYALDSGEEIREYTCWHCDYEWLEWCHSDDYPNYCPHCGEELKPPEAMTYPTT